MIALYPVPVPTNIYKHPSRVGVYAHLHDGFTLFKTGKEGHGILRFFTFLYFFIKNKGYRQGILWKILFFSIDSIVKRFLFNIILQALEHVLSLF